MATNWVTIASVDVEKFMAQSALNASSEIDGAGNGRLDGPNGLVQSVVDRIRGAVDSGNRVPLSLTANSIPPEARAHAMVIVVYELISGMPQMPGFALGAEFKARWEKAEEWVTEVLRGKYNVTYPTDPDPATIPSGPNWGDIGGANVNGVSSAQIDVTTD